MWARVFTARRKRRSFFVICMDGLLLLAFLQLDLLAGVTHALALVGLGWAHIADFRRHLADLLPVDALDEDFRLARRFDRDALGHRIADRMRKAEREVQRLALHGGAEADALELELLLVALGHAEDHVGEMRARGARLHARLFTRELHRELLLFLLDRHALVQRQRQGALGALHRHRFAGDGGRYALRQVDGSVCYT